MASSARIISEMTPQMCYYGTIELQTGAFSTLTEWPITSLLTKYDVIVAAVTVL